MKVKFTMKSTRELLRDRKLETGQSAQVFIDSEVLRRCAPYVPFDTGALNRSGVVNTVLGNGRVVYQTPYARRWYYVPANFHGAPKRGNYFFERMKNNGGKEAILRGVAKITGGRV